jgi:SnoaL-like domain
MTISSEIGPMAVVRQFVARFNDGEIDLAQALCADDARIIDDFPPHEWTGPSATMTWFSDMTQFAAEYGMSDWFVALGDPRHLPVADGHAYVVVPMEVRWLEAGTPSERAGFITAALREGTEGWRISTWAWTWA